MTDAHEGQRAWIRSALERYEVPLVHYANRIVGDLDRARDVVQETFLRLCSEERAKVEEHLGPWLYRVCRNRALDVNAKENPMLSDHELAAEKTTDRSSDPAAALQTKEDASELWTSLESLPENQREVLRLKFAHGLSYKEISQVTDLTVGNVGFLLHRGLRTLQERLAHKHPFEAQLKTSGLGQG